MTTSQLPQRYCRSCGKPEHGSIACALASNTASGRRACEVFIVDFVKKTFVKWPQRGFNEPLNIEPGHCPTCNFLAPLLTKE